MLLINKTNCKNPRVILTLFANELRMRPVDRIELDNTILKVYFKTQLVGVYNV